MVLTSQDVLDDLLVGVAWEGDFARKKDVEDNAHRPHVAFGVVALIKNFWRNIVRLYIGLN